MLENKMHIRPEDMVHTMDDDKGNDRLYINGVGVRRINEVSDYVVTKDSVTKYHEHDHGYEVFTVDRGSVEATVCGKRCMMHQGDFLVVPPFTPHGFVYKEEGTIWRELFSEMDMHGYMMDYVSILNNCPEEKREETLKEFKKVNGQTGLPEPDALWVDPKEMPFLRPKGTYVKQFRYDGIVLNMLYGRWDHNGIKELWEYVLQKGARFEWHEFHPQWDLFIVKEGSVRVNVANHEPFVAHQRDIINIPPYNLHDITALEDGAVLHDYNCRHYLFRLLQQIDVIRERRPHDLTWENIRPLMKTADCHLTGFGLTDV